MKHTLIPLLSLMVCSFANAQTTEVFDSGLFSFTYPSNYKSAEIKDAPHMVLKLASGDKLFAISYWDKGFDDSVSIWDDWIYELYKGMPIPDGEIVSITKSIIQIQNEKRRCLKILTNFYKAKGHGFDERTLMYLLLNKGFLYVIPLSSSGQYSANSSTADGDNLMKGLKFKH